MFKFSRFDARYLKFYNNIELVILKNRMSWFFKCRNFWRGNDVTELPPKLFLSIMEYLMTVSERKCHEDPQTEKNI